MMIDYNLTLNEPGIDGGTILNYWYVQCVVITQVRFAYRSDHIYIINLLFDLLLFRKKLPMGCESDFMNMLVNAMNMLVSY